MEGTGADLKTAAADTVADMAVVDTVRRHYYNSRLAEEGEVAAGNIRWRPSSNCVTRLIAPSTRCETRMRRRGVVDRVDPLCIMRLCQGSIPQLFST